MACLNIYYGYVFCRQRLIKAGSNCKDIEIYKLDVDIAVLAVVVG